MEWHDSNQLPQVEACYGENLTEYRGFSPNVSTRSYIPCKTEYDFTCWVTCDGVDNEKSAFCTQLQKLYTLPEKVVVVNFSYLNNYPGMPIYIRAQLNFTDDKCIKDIVRRCPVHLDEASKKNPMDQDFQLKEHILRCESGEPKYTHLGKLSVQTKIMASSTTKIPISYKFMCKSSCTKGIDRRPIHILFLLEDQYGTELGACKLPVKISSNPKRDYDRDMAKINPPISRPVAPTPKSPSSKVPITKRKSSSSNLEDVKSWYLTSFKTVNEKKEFLSWFYRMMEYKNLGSDMKEAISNGIKSIKS